MQMNSPSRLSATPALASNLHAKVQIGIDDINNITCRTLRLTEGKDTGVVHFEDGSVPENAEG